MLDMVRALRAALAAIFLLCNIVSPVHADETLPTRIGPILGKLEIAKRDATAFLQRVITDRNNELFSAEQYAAIETAYGRARISSEALIDALHQQVEASQQLVHQDAFAAMQSALLADIQVLALAVDEAYGSACTVTGEGIAVCPAEIISIMTFVVSLAALALMAAWDIEDRIGDAAIVADVLRQLEENRWPTIEQVFLNVLASPVPRPEVTLSN